jgi:pyruvate dehydrogenase E2 component (dihydrolipoamide acetyltransferase)
MAEFVMPSLGADMEAGTLVAWLKQPGETVERGQLIAEIDTDKGVIEVECFLSGVIEKLIIQPGEKVPVGTVMAIIQAEEQAEGAPVSRELPKEKEITAPPAPVSAVVQETQPEAARLRISPAARKAAEELAVDPATVKGSGPGGRITREDIERAATKRKAGAVQVEAPADKHARMRQAIAAAMARSKREIPHYYLNTTIDLSRSLQ